MRRVIVLLLSLSLLVGALPGAALAAPAQGGTWIVTLRDGVDARTAAPALARQHGGVADFVYTHALNGFAFRGSAASAGALARNPQVAFVEADAPVQLETTQSAATWGLDRIDQRSLPLDTAYTYQATGSGVTAYVIDSGIRTSHGEFDGRATASAASDFVGDGRNGQDCNGHGTHVAGTIGGETYGVAKAVSLVSVRVFGCTGGSAWSVIIAGIDWVTKNATKPAVANLSLSGGGSFSADNALKNMIASGVSASVAAGNSGADACSYSPARVGAAMTIGATDKTDTKPSWSNYGSCVDWFAPGVSITSAAISSDTATTSKSGTSMAAPHTAGVVALYLQGNRSASAQTVRDAIFANTIKNAVAASSSANDDLLYMGFLNDSVSTDSPPTVAISGPVAGSTVSDTVPITATASDDVAVDAVEFFVDGVSLGLGSAADDVWSASWDTTTSDDGQHQVTAVATDTEGQSASSAVVVTVSNATVSDSMSTAITASASASGSSWTATFTVTVVDAAQDPVAGATVAWTSSTGGSGQCPTDGSGQCIVSQTQHKRVGSVTLTVSDVTHGSLTWTGSVKSATVFKP